MRVAAWDGWIRGRDDLYDSCTGRRWNGFPDQASLYTWAPSSPLKSQFGIFKAVTTMAELGQHRRNGCQRAWLDG